MKLLLDENLPRQLKARLTGHEVFTVADMQWKGIENGALLKLLLENGFEGMISLDSSLPYQQNYQNYSIPILILHVRSNSWKLLQLYIPEMLKALEGELKSGPNILDLKGMEI